MMSRTRANAILEEEGLSLPDYDSTVFVFVDGRLLADSETLESATEMVAKAREYGETADLFQWNG